MELRVKEVRGIETIFDFDPKDRGLKLFIDTKNFWDINNHPTEIRIAAEQYLYNLVQDYLSKLQLSVEQNKFFVRKGKPNIIFVHVNDDILVSCEGTKLIPGREDYLDGYKPIIKFNISPDLIRATPILNREGRWELGVITDILERTYSGGDGISMPKLGRVEDNPTFRGQLAVASIEQVPRVLNGAKKLYERIGDSTFKKLCELEEGIGRIIHAPFSSKPPEEDEAVRVLRQEYNRRISSLISADL